MSRIGKQPVEIPSGIEAEIKGKTLRIKGPKGELEKDIPRQLGIAKEGNKIVLELKSKSKFGKSLFGTYRALISNMVEGVKEGWEKKLELVGTGYRAEAKGKTLILTVGFSHPVEIGAPEGIEFKVEKTEITVSGADKEKVGQVAAEIRDVRPPEPYKGKGIKYVGEVIRRKAGKAAKAVGAM